MEDFSQSTILHGVKIFKAYGAKNGKVLHLRMVWTERGGGRFPD